LIKEASKGVDLQAVVLHGTKRSSGAATERKGKYRRRKTDKILQRKLEEDSEETKWEFLGKISDLEEVDKKEARVWYKRGEMDAQNRLNIMWAWARF
jgi:hypothetical protein